MESKMATTGELDLVEAATRARVGYHVVHGWALRGLVIAQRRLGRWVVNEESLDAFLRARAKERHETRPSTGAP